MKWFLAKIVYRIICGSGNHTPQFDEQLRLIEADSEEDAFKKATSIGFNEEARFFNSRQQLVSWQFINVSEIYLLEDLRHGVEIYSRVTEVDDVETYISLINKKAESISETQYSLAG